MHIFVFLNYWLPFKLWSLRDFVRVIKSFCVCLYVSYTNNPSIVIVANFNAEYRIVSLQVGRQAPLPPAISWIGRNDLIQVDVVPGPIISSVTILRTCQVRWLLSKRLGLTNWKQVRRVPGLVSFLLRLNVIVWHLLKAATCWYSLF